MPQPSSTSPLAQWLEPHPRLDGIALIDHLFNRLDGLYPHRWRSAFPNEQAIANWRIAWAEGLAAEGITPEEVKRGLEACRSQFEWPPSLAEFVKACRPPIDFEAAYREACEQMRLREIGCDRWSHPAIYWAAVSIGSFDLRNSTWGNIKTRWTAALRAELDKREWPEIPPRREALPQPGKVTIPQEEARRRIAAMRDMIARKLENAA